MNIAVLNMQLVGIFQSRIFSQWGTVGGFQFKIFQYYRRSRFHVMKFPAWNPPTQRCPAWSHHNIRTLATGRAECCKEGEGMEVRKEGRKVKEGERG